MTTSGLHREKPFEDAVCSRLAANGWLHDPADAARYDRERALFPPDLVAWREEQVFAGREALL